MHQSLLDRVVLVTGAGGGIGRGIALAAAERGARVIVTALTATEAGVVAAEIKARGGIAASIACDVTDPAQVATAIVFAVANHGGLHAVVHSATSRQSPTSVPIVHIDEESWDDHVAVALRGTFLLARSARSELAASAGSLLVLTSNAAFHGAPDLPAYACVKGAQRGLVKALAREWGPLGIRVNALSPLAATPAMVRYLELYPEAREPLLNRAALRRFGDPELDIGAAASFLIGPDARFITGHTLVADGGGLMP